MILIEGFKAHTTKPRSRVLIDATAGQVEDALLGGNWKKDRKRDKWKKDKNVIVITSITPCFLSNRALRSFLF